MVLIPNIHWFNPENDIALAAGTANFTPPKAARAVRSAGCALPLWYANPGDLFLSADELDTAWLEGVKDDFALDVSFVEKGRTLPACMAAPWGWSAYAKKFFLGRMVPEETLPSDSRLCSLRTLSHRRTSAIVAARLIQEIKDVKLALPAIECFSASDVTLCAERFDGRFFVKAPWSSSGRGVVSSVGSSASSVLRVASDIIRKQGSVMVERAYDKVVDFARLFRCCGGVCSSVGTSVFVTDARGAYVGNMLAPETERLRALAPFVDIGVLAAVSDCLCEILGDVVAPFYDGILGVDMLVDSSGCLDAVVEVNLRTTMGYVAHRFADNFLCEGRTGVMRTFSRAAVPPEAYRVSDHRLESGCLYLSTPSEAFAYVASVDKR